MRMPQEHRNNMDMKTSAVITARMVIGSTILTDQVEMTSSEICLEICFAGGAKGGNFHSGGFHNDSGFYQQFHQRENDGFYGKHGFHETYSGKGRIWKQRFHLPLMRLYLAATR